MKTYKMEPVVVKANSFYGKAVVQEDGNTDTLISWGAPVCYITGTKIIFNLNKVTFSTSRHIKEFLSRHNISISETCKAYDVKDLKALCLVKGEVLGIKGEGFLN